ncbi:MAG: DUF1631 domain-containing protein, partial [Thiohalobacteraceae bacterium]
HIAPSFITMLDNTDVALLEFAGKAESNAAQGKFFEAMQELKRKRGELEQCFFKVVDRGFRTFINGDLDVDREPAPAPELRRSPPQLRLVEKQEVEAELPVQNMVAKANASYSELLYGLNQRLAVINGGAKLPEARLPGGPVQFAEAARTAFDLLAVDAKIRMIVYAGFERYVMRELSAMYEEYNRRLVNAGVLPNLKYEIRKAHDPRPVKANPVAASTTTGAAGSVGAPVTIGEETFQSVLELMARSHRAAVVPRGGRASAHEPPSEEVAAGARTSILGTIDSIQLEYSAADANRRFHEDVIENIGVDLNLLERLKTTLAEERQRLYGGVDRRRVAGADADIIDLVGMLFEFVLQDEQLPNAVKALLSRLHTPYLKVAIIDRQLFTEKRHPGRRLLDAMAEAGTRWVAEEDLTRGIFPCMRAMVERILRDFTDDLGLFDELLDEFNSHLREVEQKAQAIERRSVEAADGQARLHNARARANAEMDVLLRGAHLAAEPGSFLRQVWVEKLTFILLREREGDFSDAWKLAVKLAETLVWSLTPPADAAARDRLHEALPTLRADLRAGLEELQGYGRRDNDRIFTQLCDWQDRALLHPAAGESSADDEASVPESEAQHRDDVQAAEPLSPTLQAQMERLGQLAFDTWFEFIETDTGRCHRLKLAWYSKISSNYMFVDAMGVKAAEYAKGDLARRLDAGQVRILDLQSKPFLDRALETILTWLGRNKGEAVG